MRIRRTFFISLLIVLFACTPAFATVNFDVNGSQLKPNANYKLNNGVTYVEASVIDAVIGADVNVNGENIIIVHNNDKLELSVNQNKALLNAQSVNLNAAPYNQDGAFMLPLRGVLEALGFEIGWDAAEQTVLINYNETRNGMTADKLLVKSSQLMNELPAYDMKGTMTIKMNMPGIEEEGFSGELVLDSDVYAYYQKEPLTVYTKQKLNMTGIPEIPSELANTEIESAIIDNVYYMNMPGMGWVKMDLGQLGLSLDELIKQLNTQDPTSMLKQMQDFGVINNYGNDVTINGQKYYVVNTSIDKEKFFNEYKNLLKGLPVQDTLPLEELNNYDFDIKYSSFINMNTYMAEYMDMDMTMKMSIPSPENSSEVIDMAIAMKAKFQYNSTPSDFVLPDVSSAVDMPGTL